MPLPPTALRSCTDLPGIDDRLRFRSLSGSDAPTCLSDTRRVSRRLEWRDVAPGLVYEANGDAGRRYVIAVAGQTWTLDLLIDAQYQTEQAVNPRSAASLDQAKQTAQQWESDPW